LNNNRARDLFLRNQRQIAGPFCLLAWGPAENPFVPPRTSGFFMRSAGDKKEYKEIISVEEYRKLVQDSITPTEKVMERLRYLEAFCRNIIRLELEKYDTRGRGPKN